MSDAKTPDLFERFVTELENPDRRQCTGALRKDLGDGLRQARAEVEREAQEAGSEAQAAA